MAKDVLTYTPSDTSERVSSAVNNRTEPSVYQIGNGNTVSVNYVLEATYDTDDFSYPVEIASGSLSADDATSVTVSDPWDKVRAKITPSSSPGDGEIVVKMHY
jgi:hypothetical protein